MADNGNTTRTQLINLEGLSTFLDESKKIFEPTLPAGKDGQVLKLSGGKPTWGTDNTPTAFKWTNGTTAGPTGSLTGNGMSAVSFAAIPNAGASASGVVTTGAQTFAGKKTFNSTIGGSIDGNAATATSADKTAHSLSVKDGAATPAAAINSWNGSTDATLTIKGDSPVTATATNGKITISHNNSTVSTGTYKSVTVDAKGHVTAGTNPTTLSGYGISDAKIANGVITLGSNTITPLTSASTLAAGKVSGTLATSNIPNLDASKITTGTISVDRLPATALERCVVVADDTARFKLTTSSVQVGDTVKVTATKKMYMVVDSSKLSSEAGYEEYFTSTDWSTITNKPTSFTPATHSHAAATQSANGFMSAADKKKLDGVTESADSVSFSRSLTSGTKVGTITINGTGTDLYAPTNTDTHYKATPVLGASGAVTNASTETGNTATYLNIVENGGKSGGIQIKGSGATTVSAINGVLTISSTDNNTTNVSATTTGSGNAVTSVTASGSVITVTKGASFLTAHQDISGKEDKSNKVTSWSATTTDIHYPSERLVKAALDDKAASIHSHAAATQSANGFMSAADKKKLDGITESADSVSFTRSLTSGTKVGTITINGTGTDLYAPTNTDTHYTAKNVVASSSTGTANVTAATDNPYLNLIENGAVRSTHQIKGSGATTVKTDTSGNIVVSSTDTNTHYTATPVLGATNAVANATSKTSDPYLNIVENGAKSGGIQIKGSGATSVSALNGIITINSTDTNTTYSSKTAAEDGTDVSLVTTGEKYTWNSKANGVHNHDEYYYRKEKVTEMIQDPTANTPGVCVGYGLDILGGY